MREQKAAGASFAFYHIISSLHFAIIDQGRREDEELSGRLRISKDEN